MRRHQIIESQGMALFFDDGAVGGPSGWWLSQDSMQTKRFVNAPTCYSANMHEHFQESAFGESCLLWCAGKGRCEADNQGKHFDDVASHLHGCHEFLICRKPGTRYVSHLQDEITVQLKPRQRQR